MEKKTWHEWLNSLGMLIALVLAGVTFHYQFLRKTRDLRAVVLPITWAGYDGERVTVRAAIWNNGTSDEVVESGTLLLMCDGGGRIGIRKHLLGPEVIKPGEARAFTVTVKVERPDEFPRYVHWVERGPVSPLAGKIVELRVDLKTIDSDGRVVVSRAEVGALSAHNGKFTGLSEAHRSKRLDLLTGESTGEVPVGLSLENTPDK